MEGISQSKADLASSLGGNNACAINKKVNFAEKPLDCEDRSHPFNSRYVLNRINGGDRNLRSDVLKGIRNGKKDLYWESSDTLLTHEKKRPNKSLYVSLAVIFQCLLLPCAFGPPIYAYKSYLSRLKKVKSNNEYIAFQILIEDPNYKGAELPKYYGKKRCFINEVKEIIDLKKGNTVDCPDLDIKVIDEPEVVSSSNDKTQIIP